MDKIFSKHEWMKTKRERDTFVYTIHNICIPKMWYACKNQRQKKNLQWYLMPTKQEVKKSFFLSIFWQLTFIQLKSNFLKGGGKELLVWILALAASISCSVVQVMSTWLRGKNLKFRCSQDRIKRIESVTDSFDILHDDSQLTN